MAMWMCVMAIVVLIPVPAAPGPRYSSRIVDTQAGPVRGIIQSSNSRHLEPVEIFLGIPYAAPPVGHRRFAPAQDPLTWSGTRLADSDPPVCPQLLPDISNASQVLGRTPHSRYLQLQRLTTLLRNQSEDCLHLNIYVPGSGNRGMYAPYAVVVFVHGESFEWNSGNVYDGRIVTSFGHVIFVTVNYRLGIFGFLKTEEDSSDNHPCCFAISDIEAALKWINVNIGAFGGDAGRVTLMGQDTGAALVNMLLLQTSAKGLFNRAVLLSGSMLSPWATSRHAEAIRRRVAEQVGCPIAEHPQAIHCLRELPLKALMAVDLEWIKFLPRFGPWLEHSPSSELERAGGSFIDREILLGLTSIESYLDLPAWQIDQGVNMDEKDETIRTFVNSLYSYHQKEICSAVRNEYTDWNESRDAARTIRDSLLQALSDGHTVAPLTQLAYLHSRRGATTYLFHLNHQSDKELCSVGLGSVHGDILNYVLGQPLSTPRPDSKQVAVTHTLLRFFTNFAKTGDPNSPGAEPDYENDKGTNLWDMYDPLKQTYLSIGDVVMSQSHYRGHKMALWLNLVKQLLVSADHNGQDMYGEFHDDPESLYAGIVRPKAVTRPSPPTVTPATTLGSGCTWNVSIPERTPLPLHDLFKLTGPWGVTFAIGCLLLICNLLLFASVYHRHFRTGPTFRLQYRDDGVESQPVVAKSQSAPELTTSSFCSETSPKVLKRSQQNKCSV